MLIKIKFKILDFLIKKMRGLFSTALTSGKDRFGQPCAPSPDNMANHGLISRKTDTAIHAYMNNMDFSLKADASSRKGKEIHYIRTYSSLDEKDSRDLRDFLIKKPYSDNSAWSYFLDIGQIMKIMPAPPARILDLGVGSGWTSEIYARRGYSVVGIDISPEMISLSNKRSSPDLDMRFYVHDYEKSIPFGQFNACIMYDALHHAQEELAVLKNIYSCLHKEGCFICAEPGTGHSITTETLSVIQKYGTTEKDMPFAYVESLLKLAGFRTVSQIVRLSQLKTFDISKTDEVDNQKTFFNGLIHETRENGLTSIILATK